MKLFFIGIIWLLAFGGCAGAVNQAAPQVEDDEGKKNCGRAMTQRSKCKESESGRKHY